MKFFEVIKSGTVKVVSGIIGIIVFIGSIIFFLVAIYAMIKHG